MNIKYYYNYVAIVEEGSLTAASRKLRIAQPALSNQVKALEEIFGARLFHRGSRRLELTDAGSILYRKAKRIIEMETDAKNEIASGFTGATGTLRIGVSPSVISDNLYSVIKQYTEKYPKVDIVIVEDEPEELARMLQAGKVEICILHQFGAFPENFDAVFSKNEKLVAAYSKDAGFDTKFRAKAINCKHLNGLPLAVLNNYALPLRGAMKRAGGTLWLHANCSRPDTLLRLAKDGKVAAIVPESLLAEQGYSELQHKVIDDANLDNFNWGFLALAPRFRSPVSENFIRIYADAAGLKYVNTQYDS
ncbi:MAG: LysR family transcriptional regulator [Clostridia bacterium]|nr:LysR family transcriptional regulator [Clostridia bacterium]